MGKDHWDAILASVPSNATAGRVVSSGVHFDPQPERPGAFRAHSGRMNGTRRRRSNP